MDTITPFSRTRFKNAWLPEEAELLLDATNKHRTIRVYLPDCPLNIHSSLIGFDLMASELLLDRFYPWSMYEAKLLAGSPAPIFLQLGLKSGQYLMQSTVDNVEAVNGGYIVSVKVLDACSSQNKRLVPRIQYDERSGPAVSLSPPWQARLQGNLCNISQYGCLVKVYGTDIRGKFSQPQSEVSIAFNEQFSLNTKARILQCQFKRQPCCHNLLRFLFDELDSLQLAQLKAFIQTLSTCPLDETAA